ncbi:TPA: nucleotidyltransferase, partial [bacterium]|nr:nucleotidyltransferase [bacterium]
MNKNNIIEIKQVLSQNKEQLLRDYRVKEIGIFGSFVRNEQKRNSDLDILVEFEEPIGLFKFMDLEEYLKKLLGIKVDLVSKKALKPYIGKYILEEVV